MQTNESGEAAPAAASPEAGRERTDRSSPSVWIARLDADRVLVGYDQVPADRVPPGAVRVPANCDLKTNGIYRHNHNTGVFEPIPVELIAKGETAAVNQMIVATLLGLVDRATMPPAVLDQANLLEKTAPGHVAELRGKFNVAKTVAAIAPALMKKA